MDNKDLKKLAAEHNCLGLLSNPINVKFLKALFNEGINDCIDTFEMARNYKESFIEEGEELNKNHFEELKII